MSEADLWGARCRVGNARPLGCTSADLWGAEAASAAKADLWGGATQKMEEMTHEHAENIQ